MSVSDLATPLLEGFGAFSSVQKVSLLYLYHLYFLFLFNTHFIIINSQDCLYCYFFFQPKSYARLGAAPCSNVPFTRWALGWPSSCGLLQMMMHHFGNLLTPCSLLSPSHWWGELNGMTFTNLGDILTGSPHGLKGLTGVVADTCLAFLPFPD